MRARLPTARQPKTTATAATEPAKLEIPGRLAQLGEHQLDKLGSLVRAQYRPPHESPANAGFFSSQRTTRAAPGRLFGSVLGPLV